MLAIAAAIGATLGSISRSTLVAVFAALGMIIGICAAMSALFYWQIWLQFLPVSLTWCMAFLPVANLT